MIFVNAVHAFCQSPRAMGVYNYCEGQSLEIIKHTVDEGNKCVTLPISRQVNMILL